MLHFHFQKSTVTSLCPKQRPLIGETMFFIQGQRGNLVFFCSMVSENVGDNVKKCIKLCFSNMNQLKITLHYSVAEHTGSKLKTHKMNWNRKLLQLIFFLLWCHHNFDFWIMDSSNIFCLVKINVIKRILLHCNKKEMIKANC